MSEPQNTIIYPAEPTTLIGYEGKQLFSRAVMGALWKRRADLDPGQVSLLKSLYDNKSKGTLLCRTPVTYDLRRTGVGKMGYGRVYGSRGSLETIDRDLRATLCHEYYVDIDIENCHPVLAVQMAKKWFDYDMPNLRYYCENRKKLKQSWIDEFGMTEQDAKDLPIRLLNSGSILAKQKSDEPGESDFQALNPAVEQNDLIKAMRRECQEFIKMVVASKKHDELFQWCKKNKDNYNGSFISALYQTEERKCLLAMVQTLRANNFQVDVLAYDGCMVRKDKNLPVTDATLRKCEEAVKTQVGYSIVLKIKPMDDEVIPMEDLLSTSEGDDGYKAMKEEFEASHYYFAPSNAVVSVEHDGSRHYYPVGSHASSVFTVNPWVLKPDPAKPDKPNYFFPKWEQDPSRRIIRYAVMKPQEQCMEDEISMLSPFYYSLIDQEVSEEDHKENVRLFNELIDNMVAHIPGGKDGLIKTFAYILQKKLRSNICIILTSKEEGSGKDTLIEIIRRVIGKNTAWFDSDDTFYGEFNSKREGALLIHLEEAGAKSKKNQEKLRTLVTSPDMAIRRMRENPYNVPNHATIVMTTNHAMPVAITESDRRFGLLDCRTKFSEVKDATERNQLKKTYWGPIKKKVTTDSFIKSVGQYLMSYVIGDFVPSTDFPVTEYKKEMTQTVESPEEQFLRQWEPSEEGDTLGELYQKYSTFCDSNGLMGRRSAMSLNQTIIRHNSYYRKVRDRTDGRDIIRYKKP